MIIVDIGLVHPVVAGSQDYDPPSAGLDLRVRPRGAPRQGLEAIGCIALRCVVSGQGIALVEIETLLCRRGRDGGHADEEDGEEAVR